MQTSPSNSNLIKSMELTTLPCLPLCCAIECLLKQPEITSCFEMPPKTASQFTSLNDSNSSRVVSKCKLSVCRMSLEGTEEVSVFSQLFRLLSSKSIPQLYCEGVYIQHSRSILKFLSSYCPSSSWYPADDNILLRARVDDLLELDATVIYPEVSRHLAENIFQDNKSQKQQTSANRPGPTSRNNLLDCLSTLDEHLRNNGLSCRFLCGPSATIADLSIGMAIEYLLLSGFILSADDHNNIQHWLDKCRQNIKGWDESLQPMKSWIDQASNTSNQKLSAAISTYRRLSTPSVLLDEPSFDFSE
ncbi:uncharacterized protein LOC134841306 [Symsagittifera roscoffensis]|uniref:uncharacterized protein LOC134841306 n=1 Tax=Symsagittifera roscoffensis TaxID=84072 RepID=UPI00307C89D8